MSALLFYTVFISLTPPCQKLQVGLLHQAGLLS